jgi:hypothetical protein
MGYTIEDNNNGYNISKVWDICLKCGI